MLPLTLGANIGTTITGLLAALVSGKVEALQVALAHLFFNLSGIVIWYPIPFMRRVPLEGARSLGKWTRKSRAIPPIYVILVFFISPLLLLGLSTLFMQDTVAFTTLGSLIVVAVILAIARFIWFWKKQDGRQRFIDCLDRRQAMIDTKKTLPEDMVMLKAKVAQLAEHTGLPEDEEAIEEQKPTVEEAATDEEAAEPEAAATE